MEAKRGPKLAQSEVFQISSKMNVCNFFRFLHEVLAAWRLKIESNYFYGKNLLLGFLNKMQSKMNFVSSITNWCIEFFIFLHKFTEAWRLKIGENYFEKFFLKGFSGKKSQKLSRKKVLLVLWRTEAWYVFNFALSCSSIKAWKYLKRLCLWGKILVLGFSGQTHLSY